MRHSFLRDNMSEKRNWLIKVLTNRKDRISIQNAKKKHKFKIIYDIDQRIF